MQSEPQNRSKLPSRDRLVEVLTYDSVSGEFRWKLDRGRMAKKGDLAGTIEKNGRIRIIIDGVKYLAHRLAWLYMTGDDPDHDIDHEDLNPSNNRWFNLRPCTDSQNQANKLVRIDSRTGIKGVRKHGRKWIARIQVNGRREYLGLYPTREAALAAYEAAAKIAFGEYARTA